MFRTVAVASLVASLFAACNGKTPEADARRRQFDKARATLDAGRRLLAEGQMEKSREFLLRAETEAGEALKAPGAVTRAEILNLLANICAEIGLQHHPYLVRAYRYGLKAAKEAPDWALPAFNLGLVLGAMGYYTDSAVCYEQVLKSDLPLEFRAPAANNYTAMLLAESRRQLSIGRPGAHGLARKLLEKAWALNNDYGLPPELEGALTELNKQYEEETKAAIKAEDAVALARAHAECGFFLPANEVLTRARNELGRTEDLRWVEARYVEELEGSEPSLKAAAQHYLEFIGRGERLVHALAGYGRVWASLGDPDEALQRIEGFPEPSVELRVVHIDLLLQKALKLPADKAAEAEAAFKRVDELLLESIPVDERADVLVRALSAALQRGDEKRVDAWLAEFQRRYPSDSRSLLFEARLLDLRGAPLAPGDAEGGNG